MDENVEKVRDPKVISIGVRRVSGGQEVTAYSRSARGTRYRYDSVVIMTDGLAKAEKKATRAQAINQLLYR